MERYSFSSKIKNRRKKRMVVPIIYFLMEVVFIFLSLSLIQLKFDPRDWAIWSIVVFVVFEIYSILKTVNVYKRQKNYPD